MTANACAGGGAWRRSSSGKQRNGPVGKVDLTYINRFTRFENAEKKGY